MKALKLKWMLKNNFENINNKKDNNINKVIAKTIDNNLYIKPSKILNKTNINKNDINSILTSLKNNLEFKFERKFKSIKNSPNINKEEIDIVKPNEVTVFHPKKRKRTNTFKSKISSKQPLNDNTNSRQNRKSHASANPMILNLKNSNSDEKEYVEQSEIREPNNIIYNPSESRNIVNKLKFETLQFYFCFLCIRKFKNIQNALINEGMKLITEELDIRNLFKNMLKLGINKEQFHVEDILQMSDECKNK